MANHIKIFKRSDNNYLFHINKSGIINDRPLLLTFEYRKEGKVGRIYRENTRNINDIIPCDRHDELEIRWEGANKSKFENLIKKGVNIAKNELWKSIYESNFMSQDLNRIVAEWTRSFEPLIEYHLEHFPQPKK